MLVESHGCGCAARIGIRGAVKDYVSVHGEVELVETPNNKQIPMTRNSKNQTTELYWGTKSVLIIGYWDFKNSVCGYG